MTLWGVLDLDPPGAYGYPATPCVERSPQQRWAPLAHPPLQQLESKDRVFVVDLAMPCARSNHVCTRSIHL